jgi:hypothetical protein
VSMAVSEKCWPAFPQAHSVAFLLTAAFFGPANAPPGEREPEKSPTESIDSGGWSVEEVAKPKDSEEGVPVAEGWEIRQMLKTTS